MRFLKPAFTVTRTYTLTPFSRRNIFTNVDVPELGAGVQRGHPGAELPADRGGEGDLLVAGGEVFAGGTGVTATRMPPP